MQHRPAGYACRNTYTRNVSGCDKQQRVKSAAILAGHASAAQPYLQYAHCRGGQQLWLRSHACVAKLICGAKVASTLCVSEISPLMRAMKHKTTLIIVRLAWYQASCQALACDSTCVHAQWTAAYNSSSLFSHRPIMGCRSYL